MSASKCCKLVSIIFLFVAAFFLCSCSAAKDGGSSEKSKEVVITCSATKDEKYDCAVLDVKPDEFNEAGFALGDSCDVEFGNGFKLQDVPYYNGYYVQTGDPVIVTYPKNNDVVIAYNNRALWSTEGLENGVDVRITLVESGKFKTTQETLSQSYSTERSDYTSDEQFSNFRALKGGKLKEGILFRGASPVDNSRNRASITSSLLEKNQIKTILDLADTDEEIKSYFDKEDFDAPYAKSMYESGKDIVLGMSSNQDSDAYKASVAKGLRFLLANGEPAYIHCMEGKDRTGFVCMLIEAFCSATYDEMCDDYMQTYANYYGITAQNSGDKYEAVRNLYFDGFAEYLAGTDDRDVLQTFDYSSSAESYIKSCGLSDEEVAQLRSFLCTDSQS